MLSLALGPLAVSPLLTSTRDPSNSVLDGVEAAAAPPRKPFGWDAYWGAADMHAGPSYSFARQRTKIADANARAHTRSVSASAPFAAALAYPPLGELMAVQTCMPLATQHVIALGTVLAQCRTLAPPSRNWHSWLWAATRSGVAAGGGFHARPKRYPLTIRSYTRQANCCSRSVPTAYGRRWTDECVEGATNVEYCPLGTPFGNVGWKPAEGWCGKDHRSGDVCTSCTCCCPDAPPDACVQSYPTPGPTPALTPASAPCDDPKGC